MRAARRSAAILPIVCATLFGGPLAAHETNYFLGGAGRHHPFDWVSCVHALQGERYLTGDELKKKGAKQITVEETVDTICTTIDEAWKVNPNLKKEKNETAGEKNGPGIAGSDVPAAVSDLLKSERDLNVLTVTLNKARPWCAEKGGGKGIDADKIARLLAQSNILPPYYSGGIVFRNLKINGPLALYNTTVTTAVTFANSVFCGGELRRQSVGLNSFETAIYVAGSKFKKRFLISGSDIQGTIEIYESHFEGAVGLVKVKANGDAFFRKKAAGSGKEEEDAATSALIVRGTNVEGTFVILGSQFTAPVEITNNTIDRGVIMPFSTEMSIFYDKTIIRKNRFREIQVVGSQFSDVFKIATNRIEGSIQLLANSFRRPQEEKSSNIMLVGGNRVGGSFIFASVVGHFVQKFGFESNVVKGDVDIWLPALLNPRGNDDDGTSGNPEPWTGDLDLTNFQAEARLGLRYTDANMMQPSKDDEIDEVLECPEQKDVTKKKNGTVKTPVQLLKIDLTNAKIRVLEWALPMSCRYRWQGPGLRYDHWRYDSGRPKDLEWLVNWRKVMVAPEVDALNYMADYLWDRGRFVDSREILEEAKELNYTPKDADSGWEKTKLEAIRFLLRPGGFGARPEKALMLLFLGWFGFGFFYWRYIRVWSAFIPEPSDGYEIPPGFIPLDDDRDPGRFSPWRYSLDAMLPGINLHAYDRFTVERWRWIPAFQHFLGWWWLTVFLASAAIL